VCDPYCAYIEFEEEQTLKIRGIAAQFVFSALEKTSDEFAASFSQLE